MSAETAARRIAAAAVLADFGHIAVTTSPESTVTWGRWALRLASALTDLLAIPEEPAESGVGQDGTAVIVPADVPVVLGALADAAVCGLQWPTESIEGSAAVCRELAERLGAGVS
jgi:hypothetical protein